MQGDGKPCLLTGVSVRGNLMMGCHCLRVLISAIVRRTALGSLIFMPESEREWEETEEIKLERTRVEELIRALGTETPQS